MSERPRMELTDEQCEAAMRELRRRYPVTTPEAEAAMFGTWADMLAHGIEENPPDGPETGEHQ